MSFIDKYYAIFNNSVGQHSVTIKRAEFANLLGVFSKQEQQFDQLKEDNERLKFKLDNIEVDYQANKIEIEDLKNKLKILITANHNLLELDKYRQKELENKTEATKSNVHNLALLSKANKILHEIKEIAETAAKGLYTTKSDDYTDGYRWLGSIILQKISEVTENENS